MVPPLFVNFKQDFLTRIQREAGKEALVTASMIQALRWITNLEVPISGIYLNPNDFSYSALRFLEISLLQRPATPVFLIDDENEFSDTTEKPFLAKSQIRGIFKGTEPYRDLIQPLQSEVHPKLQAIKERITTRSKHLSYLAIPIIDFIHSRHFLCDVFIEDGKGELALFGTKDSVVDQEYLAKATEKTSWLFISEGSIREVRESLHKTQSGYIDLETFPISWKSAEALFNAKTLLNEMRKNGLSDQVVENTHFLLTDIFQLVSQISQSSKLEKFIQQAKRCDRTIACATLSILMCKNLKFEKGAIVEILGLASLFQDMSLYQSPHGNLSEARLDDLSGQVQNFFLQHPLLSADMVAQATTVPDVTLQVIRQHHERKDRTGYPNRVGGMQLHPMAEVLSLINEYLETMDRKDYDEAKICSHYSERVIGAFKTIVKILEHQKTVGLEKAA